MLTDIVENIIKRIRKLESIEIPSGLFLIRKDHATSDVVLSASPTLVPGTNITLPPGSYLVSGMFTFSGDAELAVGRCYVNGIPQQQDAVTRLDGVRSAGMTWHLDLEESAPVELRATIITTTGSGAVQADNTSIAVIGRYSAT